MSKLIRIPNASAMELEVIPPLMPIKDPRHRCKFEPSTVGFEGHSGRKLVEAESCDVCGAIRLPKGIFDPAVLPKPADTKTIRTHAKSVA